MHLLKLIIKTTFIYSFFSCSPIVKNENVIKAFELSLVDSSRVDYLGNLQIKDYDPSLDHYLGYNNQKREIVIFTGSGDIINQFILLDEGPGAVSGFGLNPKFGPDQITVLGDGLYILDRNGKLLKEAEIPYPHYFEVVGGNNAAFTLGEKLVYPKPGNAEEGRDDVAAYREMVNGGPMLEVLDLGDNSHYPTMHFPENNAYEDGLFYGYANPIVVNKEDGWYLSIPNAMEFHVYKEQDGKVNYQQTVPIAAQSVYLDKPVPLEQMDQYFSENGHVYRIPQIHRILPMDDYLLIFYSKGVSPDTKAKYDLSNPAEREALMDEFPMEYAVFDTEFDQKVSDLMVPPEMLYHSAIVNKSGNIVAIKNQEHFGEEEDFHIIYEYSLQKP